MGLDNLKGRRFGERVVLRRAGSNKWQNVLWLVRCDCGKRDIVTSWNLKTGGADRCHRCARRQRGFTGKYVAEYGAYSAMLQRCFNPKNCAYHNYGGRGITVADCWRGPGGFAQFIVDLGKRPSGKSLDRKNVEGPYAPGNVRWATDRTQRRNQRRNYTPEELTALRVQARAIAIEMDPTMSDEELEVF